MSNYHHVQLTAAGDRKVGVMKKLQELKGIGLKEAKEMLAALPLDVAELPFEEAETLQKELEELGAATMLRRSGRFDEVEGASYSLALHSAGPDLARVAARLAGIRSEPDDAELHDLVGRGQFVVADGLTAATAREYVEELEVLGAVVYVVVHPA